ncbi:hypothetical protein [Marinobacterium rhizophilum]|uniref:Nickel/cobalt transporter regulator n=1 Tax=Marinobacterium rhizophilum TaxID=420402 RepID=A0ABY5HLL1_9GAMM|nr:hypothetical protein [Marinobacterium rhizophilum]UTW12483.1 hypothetical protein KDW95_02015 [Marinobacterium rhizophilum]
MRNISRLCTLAVLLAALPLTTLAEKPDDKPGNRHDKKQEQPQQKHKNKSQDKEHQTQVKDGAPRHEARLHAPMGESDRDYIRHYFGGGDPGTGAKQKTLPPGLQKKLERGGDLPPGWQKKVARGEVLEPDLRRRAQRLPADLNQALHGYDANTELLLLEDRVVRVATGQGTVLDVIDIADILVR